MKKVITIILFTFLLCLGKSNAGIYDSTAYAKECFQNAKIEIENMLAGKIPLNYERAVFLTENAYWSNIFSDSLFSDLIDFHSTNIKIFAESNRSKKAKDFKSDFISTKEQKLKDYNNALYNWAIFKYLTDTTVFLYDSSFYYQEPLKYSTKDPLGTLNWENSQVLSLLNPESRTGNCMAMTALFKIFSERLNTNANIGTAPGHVFIIHNDDKGIEFNVELATHSFPGAGSLMTLTYTSDKALYSGISMRTLNTRQSIGLCLVYLAKGYEHRFNVKDNDFMLQCAESALQYDSLNLNAMLLKAEVLESRLIKTNKTIVQLQKDSLFLQYQNLLTVLLNKGYYEMSSEMKDIILSKLRNENIGYFAKDHTPQPFQNIGVKEERYATLSWGLFDENPQPKEIERYGKTLFNSQTKKITAFKEPDSTFSNYPIDPVVFAWGIDPLAAKYPNLSPYVAFNNNPIIYIDPNGKAYIPTNKGAKTVLDEKFTRFGQDLQIGLSPGTTNTWTSNAFNAQGETFKEDEFKAKLKNSDANYTRSEIDEAWSLYQGLVTPKVYEIETTVTKENDYTYGSSNNGSTLDNKELKTKNDEYAKFTGLIGEGNQLSQEVADAVYKGTAVNTTDDQGNSNSVTINPDSRGKGWAFFKNKDFTSGNSKVKGVIVIDATNKNTNQTFKEILDATKSDQSN